MYEKGGKKEESPNHNGGLFILFCVYQQKSQKVAKSRARRSAAPYRFGADERFERGLSVAQRKRHPH